MHATLTKLKDEPRGVARGWDVPAKPISMRALVPLSALLALAACVSQPSPLGSFTVLPGKGRDLTAFQQDDAICSRHAMQHSGYASTGNSNPTHPGTGAPAPALAQPPDGTRPDTVGYLQCMASRGDAVLQQPAYAVSALPYDYAGTPYGYAYDEPIDVPYAYGFPFGVAGFYGGFGWGHNGWHRGLYKSWGHTRGGFTHGGYGHGGGGHR